MDVWWMLPAVVPIAVIGVVYAVLRSRGSKMDRMDRLEAATTAERDVVAERESSRPGTLRAEDHARQSASLETDRSTRTQKSLVP